MKISRTVVLVTGIVATVFSLAGCAVDVKPDEERSDEQAADEQDEQDEQVTTAEQAVICPDIECPESGCSCGTAPLPPIDLWVVRLTSAVKLSWWDNSYNETGFRIRRRRAGTTAWIQPTNPQYPNGPNGSPLWPYEPNPVPANVITWVDRTATPGVQYEYQVIAYNSYGSRASSSIMVTVPQRPLVTNLSASQRGALAAMMNYFLTDAMVARHPYFRHHSSGAGFLYDHRRYIQEVEDYLVDHGQSSLVPLGMWDSATAIPSELRPIRARDDGTPRAPITNPTPGLPRPSYLVPNQSCSYPTLEDLGMSAQSPWHNDVHVTIGGSMAYIPTASSAYIFLPWHAYVDDVWTLWQKSCRSD